MGERKLWRSNRFLVIGRNIINHGKILNFAPILIVKYEDLIKDTKSTLISILDFFK